MYDENERNERHDQDVDYTEGAYSDSAYEEKNNDTAKKEETSDYGGYHDSRYRGSLDGEPEAARTQLYSGRTEWPGTWL